MHYASVGSMALSLVSISIFPTVAAPTKKGNGNQPKKASPTQPFPTASFLISRHLNRANPLRLSNRPYEVAQLNFHLPPFAATATTPAVFYQFTYMASPLFSSLVFLVLILIVRSSEAKDFLVGGNTVAWKIPSSPSQTLSQWAEANRFQVGDSLVWKYDGKKDSVLEVTREHYLSCNTSSPIAEHKDGNTVVKLPRSGPFYFISGAEGACEKGEKLIVVVMSERHRRFGGLSPAPSPMDYDGPAMAPMSGGRKLTVGIKGGLVGALAVIGMVARIL